MEMPVAATTFVDAQYVIAFVNGRDQLHSKAVELSSRFIGQPLLTTDVVLIEIGNALARNHRSEALEVIEYFHRAANVEVVSLTPALFAQAIALYQAHNDKTWGMTDCISFVVMHEIGIRDALTHDRDFTQAGFNALLRDA